MPPVDGQRTASEAAFVAGSGSSGSSNGGTWFVDLPNQQERAAIWEIVIEKHGPSIRHSISAAKPPFASELRKIFLAVGAHFATGIGLPSPLMPITSFLYILQTLFLTLGLMAALAGCAKHSDTPATPDAPPLPTPSSSKPFGVEAFDVDKSGDVSKEEFVSYHTQRLNNQFKASDANKDGRLSQAELTRPAPRRILTPVSPTSPASASGPVIAPTPDTNRKIIQPAASTPGKGEGGTAP